MSFVAFMLVDTTIINSNRIIYIMESAASADSSTYPTGEDACFSLMLRAFTL